MRELKLCKHSNPPKGKKTYTILVFLHHDSYKLLVGIYSSLSVPKMVFSITQSTLFPLLCIMLFAKQVLNLFTKTFLLDVKLAIESAIVLQQ